MSIVMSFILKAFIVIFLTVSIEGYIVGHHMVSRSSYLTNCYDRYKRIIARQCTYPKMDYPCLNGTEVYNGRLYQKYSIQSIALFCCQTKCSSYDIYSNYCCLTKDCLKSCYNLDFEPEPRVIYDSDSTYTNAIGLKPKDNGLGGYNLGLSRPYIRK
uniref:Uncharacterized protein n=1 Tax=Acrobeloides nanus TaxID=290746 RepID=A0A914CIR7_9BILA